jgi:hypothetical protein
LDQLRLGRSPFARSHGERPMQDARRMQHWAAG